MPRTPPPPRPDADLSFEPTGLDESANAEASTDDAFAPAPAAQVGRDAPSIGKVDRFELKSVLGEGGLGTVYAAWDALLSRMVALKTLHVDADPADREALDALFLKEAQAAAGLSHAHIVTVFEAGHSDSGFYIAMERLQGQDLRHLLKRGMLAPAESAQVACRVAEALAYAHGQKVIHCDIKPANIFMTERTFPKVLDFGIARVAHRDVPALEGMTAGSPYYLSPEQLEGRAVDERTDVYSLGVVLYELLTGRKPFEGGRLEDIVHAVKTAEVVPAHRGSPTVPIRLSEIAARAMARDPALRYPSASALATELREWLGSAEQGGIGEAAPMPSGSGGSRRGLIAVVAVAGIALIAGVLAWKKLGGTPSDTSAAASAPSAVQASAPSRMVDVPPLAALPSTPASVAALPAPTPSGPQATAVAAAAAVTAAAPPTAPVTSAAVPDGASAAASKAGDRAALALAKAEAARRRKASAVAAARQAAPNTAAPSEGTVQLAVSPWGQVEVDGKSMGTSPPLAHLTLSSGNHTITVRNTDFPAYSATVTVAGDSPVVFRHRFGP